MQEGAAAFAQVAARQRADAIAGNELCYAPLQRLSRFALYMVSLSRDLSDRPGQERQLRRSHPQSRKQCIGVIKERGEAGHEVCRACSTRRTV